MVSEYKLRELGKELENVFRELALLIDEFNSYDFQCLKILGRFIKGDSLPDSKDSRFVIVFNDGKISKIVIYPEVYELPGIKIIYDSSSGVLYIDKELDVKTSSFVKFMNQVDLVEPEKFVEIVKKLINKAIEFIKDLMSKLKQLQISEATECKSINYDLSFSSTVSVDRKYRDYMTFRITIPANICRNNQWLYRKKVMVYLKVIK